MCYDQIEQCNADAEVRTWSNPNKIKLILLLQWSVILIQKKQTMIILLTCNDLRITQNTIYNFTG